MGELVAMTNEVILQSLDSKFVPTNQQFDLLLQYFFFFLSSYRVFVALFMA